jgi:hypothetical protein
MKEITEKQTMNSYLPNQDLKFSIGGMDISFRYNNHSVWVIAHDMNSSNRNIVLYYAYSPINDSMRMTNIYIKIDDDTYTPVSIESTEIYKEFMAELKNLAYSLKDKILIEHQKYMEIIEKKENSTIDLIRQSNLYHLFKVK